ncbi:MAG: type II secretion system protein M [Pseudoxanthomonas sp.]|nr:type II secretion system protein M [Pseudoxanthomonas sp.]
MPPAIADRDRWLALGLLLAALALVYLLLVHPWWTAPMLQVNAQLQDSRERELIVRTELQQAPDIQRRLAETTAQLARRPSFLPESSAELATASLVKRLETVVGDASPGNRSCAINNRSPLPSANGEERFTQVVVQVRLQCGTPELAAVLHALESGTPRLFVDNLNVLGTDYSFQFGAGNAPNSGLDVSFDLSGYLRPSSAPAPVAAGSARSVETGLVDAN